jgi:N utilization substance protein B
VTINEYINIAKQYSTPQSGQLLNGVLDNILRSGKGRQNKKTGQKGLIVHFWD